MVKNRITLHRGYSVESAMAQMIDSEVARVHHTMKAKVYSINRPSVWWRCVRLRKERERRTDSAYHSRAYQSIACGSIRVHVLRSNDPDNQAPGDHAGNPPGMVVALNSRRLCDRGTRSIEFDAQYSCTIEAEPYSSRIPLRVTEQIAVGHAAEEAMDQAIIHCGNDNGLPWRETGKTVPRRIGWRPRRVGQNLCTCGRYAEEQGDENNRESFHDSRC